ncbi:helix-turn-helix domain-containing protein [Edaphobacter paludis]|uniref:Helix-turn-helix domain-containing protein n=1 Tax=Edaphobacter paludis TaxID=3035702 RepID=A0AAU7D5V5_9BACT
MIETFGSTQKHQYDTEGSDNRAGKSYKLKPLLVARKQAASLLGISLRALDYLTAEGRLKTRRIGGRVLIAYSELERFANRDSIAPMVPQAAA